MKKLRLEIELEYDGEMMHSNDKESIDWFMTDVLLNPIDGEGLTLHSNCICDELGECRVIKILD